MWSCTMIFEATGSTLAMSPRIPSKAWASSLRLMRLGSCDSGSGTFASRWIPWSCKNCVKRLCCDSLSAPFCVSSGIVGAVSWAPRHLCM